MENKITYFSTRPNQSTVKKIKSFAVAWLHTTGPEILRDSVFQVGGIRLDDSGKREERIWLVDPKKPITRTARLRSGINNSELRGKPDFQKIQNEIELFFQGCDLIFIPGFSNQVEWFNKKVIPAKSLALHDLFILAQYFLPEIEVYDPASLHYFTHRKPLPSKSLKPILDTSLKILHRIVEKISSDPRPFYRVLPDLLTMTEDRSLQVVSRLIEDAKQFSFGPNLNIFETSKLKNKAELSLIDGEEILKSLWLKGSVTKLKEPPVNDKDQEADDKPVLSKQYAEEVFDLIGKDIQKYKKRSKQSVYSNAVSDALISADISFVESGTGTGKSLGYLLAAMDLLEKSKNEKLIISTATKNLQTQLLEREIPRLAKRFPNMRTAILKGKGNYLCLSALKRAYRTWFEQNDPSDATLESRGAWIYLVNLVHSLNNGDLEIIPRRLFSWFPSLRQMIQDTNAASHCKVGSCKPELDIYGRIKQKAFMSDMIITNHYKIASLDDEFMQSVQYFIIDEADQFGRAVRNSLSFEVSSKELRVFLSRLNGSSRRGYLTLLDEYIQGLKRKLTPEEKEKALLLIKQAKRSLIELDDLIKNAGELFFYHLPEWEQRKIKRGIKSHEDFLLEKLPGMNDGKIMKKYCELISGIMGLLSQKLKEISEMDKIAQRHCDRCHTYALLSEDFSSTIKTTGEEFNNDEVAHSLRIVNEKEWVITRHQVYIGEFLQETFYSKGKKMVYTSATLSVNNTFDHFKTQYGVDETMLKVNEASIGTLLDHNIQSVAIVDLSVAQYNYKNPEAMKQWRQDITKSIGLYGWAANGRTLVLFTNIMDMNYSFKYLKLFFQQFDIQPLIQNGSSLEEIDEFRRNEFSILFGVDRFWSGVDFPGVTLSQVIIVKAPNPSLSDPVIQHRILHESDFMSKDYNTIAKLKLKQGAGRLLRNEGDRGGIVILDSRYRTNSYFTNHLSALPSTVIMEQNQSLILNSILKKAGLIDEYKLRGLNADGIVNKYFNNTFHPNRKPKIKVNSVTSITSQP